MVHEVYDALFFSPYLSFPLEGKSREAGKGVRGRVPIRCSIAVLTANRRPPERSDAQNVVSRFPCGDTTRRHQAAITLGPEAR